LYYSITDVNKCGYKISRNLSRKRLSDLNSVNHGFGNRLYPNPIAMQGKLFFEKPVSGLIQIYDALGQKVYEQNGSSEGVYFIELDLKTAGLYWINLGSAGVYGLLVE
jgi:hypothetical protein